MPRENVIVPLDAQKYVTLNARYHFTQNVTARRKEAHKTLLDALVVACRAKDHSNLYLKTWPAYRGYATVMGISLTESTLSAYANTLAQEVYSFWIVAGQSFTQYMSEEERKNRREDLVMGVLRRDKHLYAEMQFEAGNVEMHAYQASFPDYVKEPDWTPLLAAGCATTAYDSMLQEMMLATAITLRGALAKDEILHIRQTARNNARDHCEAVFRQIVAAGEYKDWEDHDGSMG